MKAFGTALLTLAIIAACGGDSDGNPTDPESQPAALEPTLAVDRAETGTTLSPTVRVVDSEGGAAAAVQVAWDVVSGGGEVSSTTTTTAPDGRTTNQWTLGSQVGSQSLRASVSGVGSVSFTVEARAAPLVCPALSLARTTSAPVDTVRFDGLPPELEEPLAARVIAGPDTAFTFAARSGGDAGLFLAPLHPRGEVAGGTVQLELTDGTLNCPALSFEIEAVQPAPEAFEATVDSLGALVEVQANLMGIKVEDLHTNRPDTLPQVLWPLFVAENVLGNPSNPNSLAAIVDGTAPILQDMEWKPELAGALLARAGVPDALGVQLQHIRGGGTAGGLTGAPEPMINFSVDVCRSPGSAEELHECMSLASRASQAQGGVVNQALQNWSSDVLVWVGLVPQLSAAVGVISSGIWVADKVMAGASRLLPSRFVAMDYTLTPSSFPEDSEKEGEWKDAWVQAQSDGWTLDQAILEGIMQILGARQQYDDYINGFLRNRGAKEAAQDFIMTEGTNKLISEAGDAGIISISGSTTEEVDISAEAWSNSDVLAEPAIQLLDHKRYEPEMVGQAILRVETERSKFGGIHRKTDKDVEVKAIQVSVSPDYVVVEPGDEVEFTVTVENSEHPEKVQVEVDHTTANVSFSGDNQSTVTVATPADGEKYPLLLTARSTSDTGLRARGGAPPRTGTATISTDVGVQVSPTGTCMTFGESMDFDAQVFGTEDQRVEWEASAGSIDADGTFTAPDTAGQAEVVATSAVDPDRGGTATVIVSESCTCWWTATASGGGFSASLSGDSISYAGEINDDGSLGKVDFFVFGGGVGFQPGFSFHTILPLPPLSGDAEVTGYPARVSGTTELSGGYTLSWGTGAEEDEATGLLDLVENGLVRLVRGRASGVMRGRLDTPEFDTEDIIVSVDIQFQADLAPLLLEITGQDPASFCRVGG